MRWRHLVGTAVLALGTSLVTVIVPGAASGATPGGTIVFIKGHNVWLVLADGTGEYQVTTDGTYASPYMSPSMSDAGIIAVGKGNEIVRMRQNGDVLNRMDPHPLPGSAGVALDGPPVHVAISPDGNRIAYAFVNQQCPVGVSCGVRTATGVTGATELTPPQLTNYFRHPSWVTDSRLMTHGGYQSQMMLQDLGGAAAHWFDDDDMVPEGFLSTDLDDGAVSRDGSRLAVIRGYGEDTTLFLAEVTGDVRTGAIGGIPDPTYTCATNEDENLASPSWGPDNRSVVAAETGGLTVITEQPGCDYLNRSIAPGGSEPHWSPAALNPGKKGGNDQDRATKKLKAKKKPKINGTAEVGRKLKATTGKWSKKPKKVTYRWLRNGKAITGKRGAQRVYRVVRADRGKRLQVRVTAKRPGFKKATVKSKAVRVRR